MKKVVLSIVLICSVTYLMAQDNTMLQLYLAQKQYEKAKEEVDKTLANPKLKEKDKPDAYLWKMLVYSYLYADSALNPKYPGADVAALDAFYKYQALEPDLKKLKEGHFEAGIGNVDQGYINYGNEFWTNKKYDSAFVYFSKALGTRNILYANKLTQTEAAMDTTLTLFTGIAAQESKQYDSAAKYYSQIADLKISKPDYKSIYEFLIQYYSQQKNNEAFGKYLALAKELYPADNATWSQYEMNNMTTNTSLTDLLQKFQQESAAGTLTEDKLVAFAEAFATNDSTQLAPLDSAQRVQLKLAAAQAYGKAFDLSNNGLYAFGAGYYYFLIFETLDDRYNSYRGESAALKARRAEIAKEQHAFADLAAPWLEKAVAALSAKENRERVETSNLNHAVDFLATIYYWKRERTKVDGNSSDYDKFDALYKKFDDLHNTFK